MSSEQRRDPNSDTEDSTNSSQVEAVNEMKGVEAEGDVNQTNEVHQHQVSSDEGTEIRDPDSENSLIEFFALFSELPIDEERLFKWSVGSGGLGSMITVIWFATPWNGLGGDLSMQPQVWLLMVSIAFLAFGLGGQDTKRKSSCPKCGEEYCFKTKAIDKTDRTELTGTDDRIHGKRKRKCTECGYSETFVDDWNEEEFKRLSS